MPFAFPLYIWSFFVSSVILLFLRRREKMKPFHRFRTGRGSHFYNFQNLAASVVVLCERGDASPSLSMKTNFCIFHNCSSGAAELASSAAKLVSDRTLAGLD